MLWALALFFIVTPLALAQPSFVQGSESSSTLTVINIKNDAFPKDSPFKIHTHVYNSTGFLLQPVTEVNCTIHIYNGTNDHIIERNMTADSNGVDFELELNKSYSATIGYYPYQIYCVSVREAPGSPTIREAGFIAGAYDITNDGHLHVDFFNNLAIVAILLSSVFLLYLSGTAFEFFLFRTKDMKRQSWVKLLAINIVLWLLPFMTNIGIKLAEAGTTFHDSLNLFQTLYIVTLVFAITATAISGILTLQSILMLFGVDLVANFRGGKNG